MHPAERARHTALTPTCAETFDAELGTEWDLVLRNPMDGRRPKVGFRDALGYDCGVSGWMSTDDRHKVVVRSRSGLPLRGTITIVYHPAVRAIPREVPSSWRCSVVRSA